MVLSATSGTTPHGVEDMAPADLARGAGGPGGDRYAVQIQCHHLGHGADARERYGGDVRQSIDIGSDHDAVRDERLSTRLERVPEPRQPCRLTGLDGVEGRSEA